MGIKIRKKNLSRSGEIYLSQIHQGQENPNKFKKNIPRSRKRCHDQEKFLKTKRTSQRFNSKDSGNYQRQIPLPYGTQNTQQMARKDLIRTNYHEKITIRYPEK
jgi:hypothetical protein